MGNETGQDETPAQKKERAGQLRDCAARARGIAGALGPYLDKAVNRATANPSIWTGPYATATTRMLAGHRSSLGTMASDLLADAARWEAEANRLEDEALKDAAQHGAKQTDPGLDFDDEPAPDKENVDDALAYFDDHIGDSDADMDQKIKEGHAFTVGSILHLHAIDSRLVGSHEYSVQSVNTNAHPPTITLFNPWGRSSEHSDPPVPSTVTETESQYERYFDKVAFTRTRA